MKIAIVHDWLTGMRGGERVLEELCGLFPDATLFTLIHQRGTVSERIESMPIRVSPLGRIDLLSRRYRSLLPLFPWAISTFDLSGFDLVLSNSHAVAKGVRKPPGSLHICNCMTPIRYIWDTGADYFKYGDRLRVRRAGLAVMRRALRAWDRSTAAGVDRFIAISRVVQERIMGCYRRESEVIHPPVDTRFFTRKAKGEASDFFLIVSALVPYKRIDLAISAFRELDQRLVIAGDGPDREILERSAGPNVRFAGRVTNEELRELYRRCSAVLVPGQEDFGLVSLEAQACGKPAIALAAGGSLETVVHGRTGILFPSQTVESLTAALQLFRTCSFNSEVLREHAERFSTARFRTRMFDFVRRALDEHRGTANRGELTCGAAAG
jgi:glycosyltransferase involved in cell wall biosynthesis